MHGCTLKDLLDQLNSCFPILIKFLRQGRDYYGLQCSGCSRCALLVHCNSTKHSVRFHQNSGSVDFGVKSHQAAEEAFWRADCWRINHSLLGLVSNDCENNFSLYHQRGKILAHRIDPAAFSHYCGIVPTHVVHMHDFNSIIYLLHSAGGRVGDVGGCGGCFQFINNKLSHTAAQN